MKRCIVVELPNGNVFFDRKGSQYIVNKDKTKVERAKTSEWVAIECRYSGWVGICENESCEAIGLFKVVSQYDNWPTSLEDIVKAHGI